MTPHEAFPQHFPKDYRRVPTGLHRFWFVYGREGDRPGTCQHPSRPLAESEVVRLRGLGFKASDVQEDP